MDFLESKTGTGRDHPQHLVSWISGQCDLMQPLPDLDACCRCMRIAGLLGKLTPSQFHRFGLTLRNTITEVSDAFPGFRGNVVRLLAIIHNVIPDSESSRRGFPRRKVSSNHAQS